MCGATAAAAAAVSKKSRLSISSTSRQKVFNDPSFTDGSDISWKCLRNRGCQSLFKNPDDNEKMSRLGSLVDPDLRGRRRDCDRDLLLSSSVFPPSPFSVEFLKKVKDKSAVMFDMRLFR